MSVLALKVTFISAFLNSATLGFLEKAPISFINRLQESDKTVVTSTPPDGCCKCRVGRAVGEPEEYFRQSKRTYSVHRDYCWVYQGLEWAIIRLTRKIGQ